MLANEDHCGTCSNAKFHVHADMHNKNASQRYNEYMNLAIRDRNYKKKEMSIEKQIEYYICMH